MSVVERYDENGNFEYSTNMGDFGYHPITYVKSLRGKETIVIDINQVDCKTLKFLMGKLRSRQAYKYLAIFEAIIIAALLIALFKS